jgi:hypothetical protein
MIDYDGRRFINPDAETGADSPVAVYHQRGDLVWADFDGGEVVRGSLTGVCDPDGTIRFAYSMVLTGGRLVSGQSVNVPQILDDGRIRLHERWQRFGDGATSGESRIEELPRATGATGPALLEMDAGSIDRTESIE